MHERESIANDVIGDLSQDSLFVSVDSGVAVSRKKGLRILLKFACVISDLDHIEKEDWDAMGQLQASHLRGRHEEVLQCLLTAASRFALQLSEVLGPQLLDSDDEGFPRAFLEPVESTGASHDGAPVASSSRLVPPPAHRSPADHPPADHVAVLPRARGSRADSLASGVSKSRSSALPDTSYLAAAREIARDTDVLDMFVAEARAPPRTAAEERTHIAFEIHARCQERARDNFTLRTESRAANEVLYGSRVKPKAPRTAKASMLPILPDGLDLSQGLVDSPPGVTPTITKRHPRPRIYQAMAHVPQRPKPARTAPKAAHTKSNPTKTRTSGTKAKLPPHKCPKPSARKVAEEPETSEEEEDEAGADFDARDVEVDEDDKTSDSDTNGKGSVDTLTACLLT